MVFKSKGKKMVVSLLGILIIGLIAACGDSNNEDPPNNENQANNNENENGDIELDQNDEGNIILGTMPVGGTINTVGNALASVISANSDVQTSVSPFAGLAAWGPSLNDGDVGLGLATEPELAWGYQGEKGFDTMENMRFLVKGNALAVPGFAVREDSGINNAADLEGKRVASDYAGSASVKAVLDAGLSMNDLTWDDVNEVPIPTTVDGMEGLRDNNVDAAYALTPNTAVSKEVHNAVGLKSFNFLDGYTPENIDDIPPEYVDEIATTVPGAKFTVLEPHGYVAEEQVGVEYYLASVASAHLNDDTVYEILKTLWEHHEEMYDVHPWLKQWNPNNMFEPNPVVPYHDGAVQFFKDQDLWTEETEEIQQDLLNEH
ncbi:TAXI family TRAP transporter solute-binding subunit [Salibacterium aidingense]|uniref:TAXI family TRAP transporter solute-binding subunit n=1 Tax=Salibacterium aidingense TaxID=384933 RepID=UPI003BDCC2BB